jgi:hypothetical protein
MLKKGQAGPMVNFELLFLHNMLSVTWDSANLGHVLQVSCPYQLRVVCLAADYGS